MKLGDFIDRVVAEYGAEISELSSLLQDQKVSIRYLLRKDAEGNLRTAVIQPGMNRATEVIDPIVRSLCRDLGIDPRDFDVDESEM